jgi:hypothetical protein
MARSHGSIWPVGQLARWSETPLRIAGLHFELSAFAPTASDQFKAPAGSSNTRNRQRLRRQRADTPARR